LSLQKGEWPVKKVIKERIIHRTLKKEFLVKWKPSWVEPKNRTSKNTDIEKENGK